MPQRDMVVVGASAGGVEAFLEFVSGLPEDLAASVFLVLHIGRSRSVLPQILQRKSHLPVAHAVHREPIRLGRVYVAPPDFHLTIDAGRIRLWHGPTENGSRPAIDPLFRSAARVYGARVIGVLLTGADDDGTAGLAEISRVGGLTIVQDPDDAVHPAMPRSAVEFVGVDHVAPLSEIAALIAREVESSRWQPRRLEATPVPATDLEAVASEERTGNVSALTCPECNGALWEIDDGGLPRFRCRVGHAYSPESLLEAQADTVDRALWAALRSLEERAALCRKLAGRSSDRGHALGAGRFEHRAAELDTHAAVLRDVITRRMPTLEAPEYAEEDEKTGAVSQIEE